MLLQKLLLKSKGSKKEKGEVGDFKITYLGSNGFRKNKNVGERL